jgi:transcriptional regulator
MTYRPPAFRNDDEHRLLELIHAFPLATLVTASGGAIYATHLPLMAVRTADGLRLQGHLARANEQWRHAPDAAAAFFRIADHYVSPTWYPSKERDPRVVPTWDYVAVEARGTLQFIHDLDWLDDMAERLTEANEARVGGTWEMDDAPHAYLEAEMKAIVGVEMAVSALTGTFKLHQHHPRENIDEVIEGLDGLGAHARELAHYMREL